MSDDRMRQLELDRERERQEELERCLERMRQEELERSMAGGNEGVT